MKRPEGEGVKREWHRAHAGVLIEDVAAADSGAIPLWRFELEEVDAAQGLSGSIVLRGRLR